MLSTVTAYVVRAQDAGTDAPPAAAPVVIPGAPGTPMVPIKNQAADAVPAVLELVPDKSQSDAPQYIYRLHDSLVIRASGAAALALRTQFTTVQPGKLVTLVLDGVPLSNLTYGLTEAAPIQFPDGRINPATVGDVLLSFQLSRDSSDDLNRKAWDALLTKHQSYQMEVPVYLSIANGVAQVVSTQHKSVTLSVGNPNTITIVSIGAFVAMLLMLVLLVRSDWLRDGNSGYYSLGKSQMAFWGVIVFVCVVAVLIVTGTLERIPPQTLGLLGISGATGLGSLLIGSSPAGAKGAKALRIELTALLEKGANATDVEKKRIATIDDLLDRRHFLRDITDDGNGTSFHRVQVVVWTVLLGVVFIRSVAAVMSMPEFPESLLLLMGISNATYLGFKFPEGSANPTTPAPAPPAPPAP